MSETTPSRQDFRSAMAGLAAAVSVLTTDGPHGRTGLTVSAACSVTDEPPTVLVCVNRSSRSHGALGGNGAVCLNVLAAGQEALAAEFAGGTGVPMAERFARPEWEHERYGVPVLAGAAVALVGRITSRVEVGSHSVLMVGVAEVLLRESPDALVYYRRAFHGLPAAPVAAAG